MSWLIFILVATAYSFVFLLPERPKIPGKQEIVVRRFGPGIQQPSEQKPIVIDGDTLRIGADRLRLIGIDTPEISNPKCERERILGMNAKNRLKRLLATKPYRIEHLGRTDRFGRRLVRLVVDGEDYADETLKEGLGVPYNGGDRDANWCR